MDRYTAAFALLILIGSSGCNKQDQPGQSTGNPNTASNADTTGNPSAAAARSTLGTAPEKAVSEFLEAIRSGNDETAAMLLTPKARQKTSEANLTVAPPGNPNATFIVGKVEFITADKNAAHVLANWTDTNEDGTKNSHELIWALRKESEGWRIAGWLMRLPQFPNKPPLVLDFEDPEDMQRTLQKFYEEESNAQNQPPGSSGAQPQAKAPAATPPAVR